ncbi:DUF58 domain-containing protein [Paenibacillus arenosi]|uniref:DUF58 domain-containing protein n=1 Tax=Paenibacillus arenosi TaxID=2774142 RepID=A0ABR9B394_9BACL|nr:DUF58 domain-containing protein [Paenibacillus arenosi]MBD8500837.1 DUF58 domain-containing protein [Paenibacillus arenosi]
MKPPLLQPCPKGQLHHKQFHLKRANPQLHHEQLRVEHTKPQPLEASGTDLGAAWLRPTAAGLLALVLLAWGIAERHGALSFMGSALLGYWLFAAWSCLTAPLRLIRTATTRCGHKIGPVETELVWTTTIHSRSRLPRMWLQVTEVWLRVDEQGEVLEQLSCTRMLYPGSQRRLICKMSLPAVTLGMYRHGGTHIVTGDLLGWWRRGRFIQPLEQALVLQHCQHADAALQPHAVGHKAIDPSHAIVVPSAVRWINDDGLQQLLMQMLRAETMSKGADGTEAYMESIDNLKPRHTSQAMIASMELRPYQKGDAWRSIQWRNYAKNRQLVVRPHQAMDETEMIILFDDCSVRGNPLSKEPFAALIDTTLEWVWRLQKSGYRGPIQLFRTCTETWVRGYESVIVHLAAGRRLGEEGTGVGSTVQSSLAAHRFFSTQASVIVISPYEASSRLASIQSDYQISSISCWIQASIQQKILTLDQAPNLDMQTDAAAQQLSERIRMGDPLNKHAGGNGDVSFHN